MGLAGVVERQVQLIQHPVVTSAALVVVRSHPPNATDDREV